MKQYKYSLTMINRNGYTIKKESDNIDALKRHAKHFPIEVFFIWIYDKINDNMVCQSIYSNRFKRCSNETFVPYF